MIVTALVLLLLMGMAVTWDRQFPQQGERWVVLSQRRKFMTVLALPAGLILVAFGLLLVLGSTKTDTVYSGLLGVGAVGTGGAIVVLMAMRLWRLRRR